MFICLFVCLFVYRFFCINHHGTPTGSYPENFVKIQLDLAEISRIRKLDWRDGRGGEEEWEKGRRRGGNSTVYLVVCLFVCFFAFIYVCWFFV